MRGVWFSRDGTRFVTVAPEKTAWLWRMPRPAEGDVERIRLWVQVVTGLELDESGTTRLLDDETRERRRQRLQELGGTPVL